MYFKDRDSHNVKGHYKTSKGGSLFSALARSSLIYLILGFIFLLGIILIIVGLKGRMGNNIADNNVTYTIKLLGDQEETIYVGSKYEDPGYWAKDSNGKNATKLIDITSNLNESRTGTYEIIYAIGDTQVTRKVNVINNNATNVLIFIKL